MKKLVSLFLALLMMCSVLFAIPAEVNAAFVKEQAEESAKAPCACGEAHLHEPGDSTMGAVTPGGGSTRPCSHTYKTVQYNASYHKRVCTKCGYSYSVSHSYGYVAKNGTYHNKVCNLCGYIAGSAVHCLSDWQSIGNYHVKTCSVCGYTIKQAHKWAYTDVNFLGHTRYCSVCVIYFNGERHTEGTCACGWHE